MRKLLLGHSRVLALVVAAGLVPLLGGTQAAAVALLAPGDPIIAVDAMLTSLSRGPAAEGAVNLVDANPGTKYLNFGIQNSGFIVTPMLGPLALDSFTITTANDHEERDPASWALYGTNDPITSANHSLGDAENWTLIGSGTLALPSARQTYGPVVPVNSSTAYASFRMVFPTLKPMTTGPNSMQIADVEFYTADAPGISKLMVGDFVIAIDTDVGASSYPNTTRIESPPKCIDGDTATKYLNFGRDGAGFIVTPSVGASIATSFQITTANDAAERDPATWELYGTNDPITSVDNGTGTAENWSLIGSGTVALPTTRLTAGEEVAVANTTAYASYRMIFPTVRSPMTAAANSVQFSEIQLFGTVVAPTDHPGDANRDGKVDDLDASILAANWQRTGDATWALADFNGDTNVNDLDASILAANWQYGVGAAVPEPTTLVLLIGLAALGLVQKARRR